VKKPALLRHTCVFQTVFRIVKMINTTHTTKGCLDKTVKLMLMFVDPCIIVYSFKKSNKMQQCIKIFLFHIYMKLNMFRATHHPSSGVQNCTGSL